MNEALHPTAIIFVATALLGALLAVSLRNVLHAIFGLALTLLSIAGLFLYLQSPFVAAMQIVIYVGGISVAMVFAVMLAYTLGARSGGSTRHLLALLPTGALAGMLAWVLLRTPFGSNGGQGDWSVAAIGRALLTHYNVVFEALSVVLLLAIIGAIVIARRSSEDKR